MAGRWTSRVTAAIMKRDVARRCGIMGRRGGSGKQHGNESKIEGRSVSKSLGGVGYA